MDMGQQRGQQNPDGNRAYNRTLESSPSQGQAPSGMADTYVSDSTLRGLDVVGASAGALMLLGPLAAVAVSMH